MPAVWKSTHAPRVGIPAEPVSVRNRKRDIRLFRLILLGESDRADKSSQTQEVGPWSHVDLCDRARRPPVRASHPGAPDVSVASEHSGRRLDVDGDAAPIAVPPSTAITWPATPWTRRHYGHAFRELSPLAQRAAEPLI
jgi:hypothetical protein